MIKLGTKSITSFLKRNNERVKALTGNMKPAHKAGVVLLFQWVLENFREEGGNHDDPGLKWKQSQRAIRENGQTLQDKGNLRRNWDLLSYNDHGKLKSQVSYSADHEYGLNGLPVRKIFPTIDQGTEIVRPAYLKFVREQVIK